MKTEQHTILSIPELKKFATDLLASLQASETEAVVIALSGDLGAGKTALVQQLAAELGIKESVTSPTFTILKRYVTQNKTFSQLLHMDAYRLDSIEELRPLHFDVLLCEPKTLFCIEWAERIMEALPNNVIKVAIEMNPNESRTVQVTRP